MGPTIYVMSFCMVEIESSCKQYNEKYSNRVKKDTSKDFAGKFF